MQNVIKIYWDITINTLWQFSASNTRIYSCRFWLDNGPLVFELSITLVFIFWSQNGTLTINNLVFYADIVLRDAAIEFLLV